MATFLYKAIDDYGKIVKGSIEDVDIETASKNIASSGLYIITIKRSNEFLASINKRLNARRIKRKDVIEFAQNLSVMIRSGVPIVSAFKDIEGTTENVYFSQTIRDMRKKVELGSSFSDALADYNYIFPDIFIRLVRVGEETGQLSHSLDDVASHLKRMDDLSSSLRRALIYPVFAIVTTIGALFFWMIYVLPKMTDLFSEMLNGVLPWPTRLLLGASDLSRDYWYIMILMPVLLFLTIVMLKRKKETRYYIDLALIKLPVFKQIVYNKLLALFTEQLWILTIAGITIDRSLEIISEVIGNEVFRRAIGNAREEISVGSRISDALRKSKIFPALVIRMIDVGETSGSLDEQCKYLAGYYLKSFDDISKKIGTIIEPLMIGFIGIIFAIILMGLLLPVYDLVSKV